MSDKIEKNRHERRKEDSEKRRQNKKLKGTGFEWCKDAQGEWQYTYNPDTDKNMGGWGNYIKNFNKVNEGFQ